jgi:hypothetical protein
MSEAVPLGRRLFADDLLGFPPIVDWQLRLRSRHLTFGARDWSNNDSHSAEYLIGTNRVRNSLVGTFGAQRAPIAILPGGHLHNTLQESGNLHRRSLQRQLEATLCEEAYLQGECGSGKFTRAS